MFWTVLKKPRFQDSFAKYKESNTLEKSDLVEGPFTTLTNLNLGTVNATYTCKTFEGHEFINILLLSSVTLFISVLYCKTNFYHPVFVQARAFNETQHPPEF